MAFSLFFMLGVPLVFAGYWLLREQGGAGREDGHNHRSQHWNWQRDGDLPRQNKSIDSNGADQAIVIHCAVSTTCESRGGRIILACRNVQRGERACSEIRQQSGIDNVIFRQLDLASCKSIRNFAERILTEEREINILINNAGIMLVPYQLTENGFESQFGVNYLGHFLLTHLLLDRIKESAPSRIITVSSLAHFTGSLDFDDMMWRGRYSSALAYSRSKLANVMFTRELAKRVSGSDVTVCSLHPGTIYTELVRYFFSSYLTPLIPLMHVFLWLFTKTAKQGSQTTIHCAVAREVEGISDYIHYKKELRIRLTDQISYSRPGVKEGVLVCESGASSTAFRKMGGKAVSLNWAGKK